MRGDNWFARDVKTLAIAVTLAAVFGALHDALDVHISPHFYYIVKHASKDAPVLLTAVFIGTTRGAVLGVLLGAGYCIANDRGPAAPLPMRRLLRWMLIPVLFAAAGSALGFLTGRVFAVQIVDSLAGHVSNAILALSTEEQIGVATVNAMHMGLYIGGMLGAMIAWRGVYRARYAQAALTAPPLCSGDS